MLKTLAANIGETISQQVFNEVSRCSMKKKIIGQQRETQLACDDLR